MLDFKGDIRATAVSHLREEISAVVSIANGKDEVVLRLENPGGAVHEHGLAASQLQRLKRRGIPLTVVVDKVAASGGYMMACIADRIVAAPFAVIGSIGVLAQLPNFNRALKDKGVDWEADNGRQIQAHGHHVRRDLGSRPPKSCARNWKRCTRCSRQLITEHRPSLDVEDGGHGRALVRHAGAGAGAGG